MYHDIGIVRKDKSLIRHRVFVTRLKEGCAEEYKRRHDALVKARGDLIKEGPESNFTIWNANGYIFGYCELVKAFDHEMTEEEKAAKIEELKTDLAAKLEAGEITQEEYDEKLAKIESGDFRLDSKGGRGIKDTKRTKKANDEINSVETVIEA